MRPDVVGVPLDPVVGGALGIVVYAVVAFLAWWFEPADGSWRD